MSVDVGDDRFGIVGRVGEGHEERADWLPVEARQIGFLAQPPLRLGLAMGIGAIVDDRGDPVAEAPGGLLSVALSFELPRLAVSQHLAL